MKKISKKILFFVGIGFVILGMLLLIILSGCVNQSLRLPINQSNQAQSNSTSVTVNSTSRIITIPAGVSLTLVNSSSDSPLKLIFFGSNATIRMCRIVNIYSIDFRNNSHNTVYLTKGKHCLIFGDSKNNTILEG
jgi:hypothetical protein